MEYDPARMFLPLILRTLFFAPPAAQYDQHDVYMYTSEYALRTYTRTHYTVTSRYMFCVSRTI